MRILHTGDWHLGKKLDKFSRFDEQVAVMREICEIADREHANAVVVAGDIFDNFNPPNEAIDLLYRTLKTLAADGERPVIVVAGNHDSPERIEAPHPLARECGILFAGFPDSYIPPFSLPSKLTLLNSEEGFMELSLPNCSHPLRILFTPYANELRLKKYLGVEGIESELQTLLGQKWQRQAEKYCDSNGVNILLAHLLMAGRGDKPPAEPEDEKPIFFVGGAQVIHTENIPVQIQYTALGHLHRKQFIRKSPFPVCYAGSPLSYSFAEENQKKYVIIADLVPNEIPVISEFELTQGRKLLRRRAENVNDALEWLEQNQSELVELTLVTETYLTAEERQRLYQVHTGIVSLIPEIRAGQVPENTPGATIDLGKSMEDLFIDFFKHKNGQVPNESLRNLFKELLSLEVKP